MLASLSRVSVEETAISSRLKPRGVAGGDHRLGQDAKVERELEVLRPAAARVADEVQIDADAPLVEANRDGLALPGELSIFARRAGQSPRRSREIALRAPSAAQPR